MTAKLDGTNGLLQQYDYQAPTTGFSYTFAAGTNVLVMNPAGTLATGTITMPAAPVDGMTITVESTQQITALTVQGNTGQSLVNGTQTLRPNQPYSWVYRLSNTTWYPFAGATNSQLVSMTVNAGGTNPFNNTLSSVDFTGIPSWVKRITVLFQSVSTGTASSPPLAFLLGTSGGFASSGYLTSTGSISGAGSVNTVSNVTTNFQFIQPSSAANSAHGKIVFENLSGNIWVGTGSLAQSDAGRLSWVTGSITLSGALDRVRMTTVGGTDTFDAGSINILYE